MVAGIANDMLYCAHRVPRVTRLYHDTPKKCMPVWDVIGNNNDIMIIIIITIIMVLMQGRPLRQLLARLGAGPALAALRGVELQLPAANKMI